MAEGGPARLGPRQHPRLGPRLRPRRHPRQERARQTVAAILEAAAELIGSEGFGRASTNRIARRAGVSIGSLYQYFPNKEAIRAALLDQHHCEVAVIIARAADRIDDPTTPLDQILREIFLDLLQLNRRNPALMQALGEAEPRHLGSAGDPANPGREFTRRLQAALRRRPEVNVPDPAIAAHILVQAVGSLARRLAHHPPPGLDSQLLVDEMVRMLAGYVVGGR